MSDRRASSAHRALRAHAGQRMIRGAAFAGPTRREGVFQSPVVERNAAVRLELESRPESVTLVRAVLAAVADAMVLGPELLNDLKTVVSEACNNVVVHAYGGFSGPLRVEVSVDDDGVAVSVRDRGVGMRIAGLDDDGMGVGLAVISALAGQAEFLTPADGGTEVRMWFPGDADAAPGEVPGARRDAAHASEAARPPIEHSLELTGDVLVTVKPVGLLTPVLGRLARALAAGARFSFDRFSDVYLVADTIGAHAERAAADDRVSFAVCSSGKRLELAMGPFAEGSGAHFKRTAAVTEHESPLALLADEIAVAPTGSLETLHVVLRDRTTPLHHER